MWIKEENEINIEDVKPADQGVAHDGIIKFGSNDEFCHWMNDAIIHFFEAMNNDLSIALNIISDVANAHIQDLSEFYQKQEIIDIYQFTNFIGNSMTILNASARPVNTSELETLENEILEKVLKIFVLVSGASPDVAEMLYSEHFLEISHNMQINELISQNNSLLCIEICSNLFRICPPVVLIEAYNLEIISFLIQQISHEFRADESLAHSDTVICECLNSFFQRAIKINEMKINEKYLQYIQYITQVHLKARIHIVRLIYFFLANRIIILKDFLKMQTFDKRSIMLFIIYQIGTYGEMSNLSIKIVNVLLRSELPPKIIYKYFIKIDFGPVIKIISELSTNDDRTVHVLHLVKNAINLDFMENVPEKFAADGQFFKILLDCNILKYILVNFEVASHSLKFAVVDILCLAIEFVLKFSFNDDGIEFLIETKIFDALISSMELGNVDLAAKIIITLRKLMENLLRSNQEVFQKVHEILCASEIGDALMEYEDTDLDEIAHGFYSFLFPETEE